MILESILTCPNCLNNETHNLYENVTPVSYRCSNCQKRVKIEKGDCCVYCKYADFPCLQTQIAGSSCCARD